MIWKSVKFNSLYEVSDAGEVRNSRTGKILRPQINRGGYRRVMFRLEGKLSGFTVARLVIEAFVGPRPFDKAEVCHNDGDKLNDCPSNLRWDSHINNIGDKRLHGTWQAGEKHGYAKLREVEVLEIRRRIGDAGTDLAEEFGVSTSTICGIRKGRLWRNVA